MVSIAILILLAWSFYIGYSRGLVLQGFYGVSSLFAILVAALTYKKLSGILYLWVPFANATQGSFNYYFNEKYLFDLDQVFYAGLAFLTVYLLVYAIMRFVGIFVHLLEAYNPDTIQSNLISGAIAVVVALLSLQMVLVLVATIPVDLVQEQLQKSFLANLLIQYIPTAHFFKAVWLSNITG